jgi:hypothetical protein
MQAEADDPTLTEQPAGASQFLPGKVGGRGLVGKNKSQMPQGRASTPNFENPVDRYDVIATGRSQNKAFAQLLDRQFNKKIDVKIGDTIESLRVLNIDVAENTVEVTDGNEKIILMTVKAKSLKAAGQNPQ